MALTFPSDTNNPYVDTTSGLKYIYNNAVGAWESAIQAPVIVTTNAPNIDLNGFLWYDQQSSAVFIRLNENWIPLVPPQVEDPDTGEIVNFTLVKISPEPPSPATHGELWWDSSLGRLFIYYLDDGSIAQWLEASPNIDGINGGIAYSGPNPPTGAVEGELWFNTSTSEMYVYFNTEWIPIKSVIDGVETLRAEAPLYIFPEDDAAKNPKIGIVDATSAVKGSVRFATQDEVDAGINGANAGSVVLSPLSLSQILNDTPSTYIADATTERKGIVELSTEAEAVEGNSTTTVVTPAGLKQALDDSGDAVPSGMIMMFATGAIPSGYLVCDGGSYLIADYADLYAVIGTTYETENVTSGFFQVPDMIGNAVDGFLGVYCIKT